MKETFKVISTSGVELTALLIRVGDRYGLTGSLLNEKIPLVEFHWPPRAGEELGPAVWGQCHASDFMGRPTGFDLYGASPDAKLDAEQVGKVGAWLRDRLGEASGRTLDEELPIR